MAAPINVILQHNPDLLLGTHYTLNVQGQLEIMLGVQGEVFEFEAIQLDNGIYVGPGNINSISARSGAGPVTLSIVGHDGHPFGARNVGYINLQNATPGNVTEVVLAEDLNGVGATNVHDLDYLSVGGGVLNTLDCDGTTGTIHIGGTLSALVRTNNLSGLLVASTSPSAAVEIWGTSVGPIQVLGGGGLDHLWVLGTVEAPIQVFGDLNALFLSNVATPEPGVQVGYVEFCNVGNLSGYLKTAGIGEATFTTIGGALKVSGSVDGFLAVQDGMSGLIDLGVLNAAPLTLVGDASGVVSIQVVESSVIRTTEGFTGQMTVGEAYGAHFWIGYDNHYNPLGGDLSGSIRVLYSQKYVEVYVSGALRDPYDPNVQGSQPLTGGYIILPSFCNQESNITIDGGMTGTTEFIAINYDGGEPQDSWCAGAEIIVDGVTYLENSREARVWEISPWKGDMNNDYELDLKDINAFVLALSNPAAYSQEFPGLGGVANDPLYPDYTGGTRVQHGDLNCDGELGFEDINPFVAFISDPCFKTDCEPCLGAEALGGPLETAQLLLDNVDCDLHATLADQLAAYVDAEPAPAKRAYWTAVLTAVEN
jgi:hypothetical protein